MVTKGTVLPYYIEIGPVVSDKKIFKGLSFGCYGNQNPAWIPIRWKIFNQYHPRIIPVKFG